MIKLNQLTIIIVASKLEAMSWKEKGEKRKIKDARYKAQGVRGLKAKTVKEKRGITDYGLEGKRAESKKRVKSGK